MATPGNLTTAARTTPGSILSNSSLIQSSPSTDAPTEAKQKLVFETDYLQSILLLLASASLQSREFSPNKNDIPHPSSMWSVVQHGHEEDVNRRKKHIRFFDGKVQVHVCIELLFSETKLYDDVRGTKTTSNHHLQVGGFMMGFISTSTAMSHRWPNFSASLAI
ncbi:hypothetical protein NC652_020058 [Populus alba x Populus x berolinensis]|nr:hypothetical protein NC652_020058 [Populus alba x Populus x berolinensis]